MRELVALAVILGLAASITAIEWLLVRRIGDVGLSIMERHDDRPDTIGTWRPARPDDQPAEDPHAWAESCGHIAELTTAVLCRLEARRGPGRHRRCYTGEWPALQEPVTSMLAEVA